VSADALPAEVASLSARFQPGPALLSKVGAFHDGSRSEALWALAPGREEKPGMKYPVLDSDQMIPFLQGVLSAFSLGYTRVSVSVDVAPDGRSAIQKIYYLVWCKETNEGMVYRQDWVSDTTHNDQAGGLTRAHRRFLKGLTGFIEHDEDKIEQFARSAARTGPYVQTAPAPPPPPPPPPSPPTPPPPSPPAVTYSQPPAPTASGQKPSPYEQRQQQQAQLPVDQQLANMAEEAFNRPIGQQQDHDAGPAASGAISRDPSQEAKVAYLWSKGWERSVAVQFVMADWVGALHENGYPSGLADALVAAVHGDPMGSVRAFDARLEEDVRQILMVSHGGSGAAVEAAFAGTGYEMAAGNPPTVAQTLWACLMSPVTTPSFP